MTENLSGIYAIDFQELRDQIQSAWNSGTGGVDLRWLVTDHLGTPRMIFDQTGSLAGVKRHDYLPFGEELFVNAGGRTLDEGYTASGALPVDGARQKFTSKERDNETGLDYFLARYYSSTQGRFTSPDPLNASGRLQEPQSWNRYSYVLNRPLALIDPNGMHDCTPQTPCVKTTEADAEAKTIANPSLALIQETVTLIIPQEPPLVTITTDPSAVSLNLKELAQPVLMNQTAPSDLELALPDYYQLEINIAIPNKLTLTAVGVSLTGTLDRNGNIYGGIGPSVGKSIPGYSGAATANYVIDGMVRTVRNEDQLASFLSGHSITAGAGFVTGSHGTWVPGNGVALGTGFYTPQIGAAYNYSLPLGNPFRAVGLMPRRTK